MRSDYLMGSLVSSRGHQEARSEHTPYPRGHSHSCGQAFFAIASGLVYTYIPLMAKALLLLDYDVLYIPWITWCYWHNVHSTNIISDWINWLSDYSQEMLYTKSSAIAIGYITTLLISVHSQIRGNHVALAPDHISVSTHSICGSKGFW